MEDAILSEKTEDIDEFVRLMTLFNEAVEDAFLLFSHSSNMVLFSTNSFRKLTGITQEGLLKEGRELLKKIIHPKDLKLLLLVHESTMKFVNRKYAEEHTAKFLFSYNFRLLCADGEFRHMNAYFKPAYFNQTGEAELSI
jgi:PAS domain-containing protein